MEGAEREGRSLGILLQILFKVGDDLGLELRGYRVDPD